MHISKVTKHFRKDKMSRTMISVDLGYVGKERLQEIRQKSGDVERMLKAMIKSLETNT